VFKQNDEVMTLINRPIKIFCVVFVSVLLAYYLMLSNIEYDALEKKLIEKKFYAADLQTTELMFRVSGRKFLGDIPFKSLTNFSCDGISRIDRLWRRYSKNKFGFTIQFEQWKSIANNRNSKDFNTDFSVFENRVGWNKEEWSKYDKMQIHDKLDFSLNAPLGELPSFHWLIKSKPIDVSWNDSAYTFFSRIEECKLR
jgi:hypothetical protein